jgi:wobble nucleotide-excising tRNase
MLEKIITIKNVGKFINYNPHGDVAFCKLTVIHAGNGQGKTTLCDILRSVHTGDGRYILGRGTLGSTGTPTVQLRLNNQTTSFTNGAWNQTTNEFLIFDASFVHDNVHSGEHVTHDHKKNLYQVIIGGTGVTLARAVASLDAELREASREIAAKTDAVLKVAPPGMSTKVFVSTETVNDVDTLIQQKEAELAALESAAAILAKPLLRQLGLPQFPSDFVSLLSATLQEVSADAEAQVAAHIAKHTRGLRESWLSEGLGFVDGNCCPFCGQPLESVPLVSAFKAYFGDAYKAHLRRITKMTAFIGDQLFPPSQLLSLQHTSLQNAAICESWNAILSLALPTFSFDVVSAAVEAIRTSSLSLLRTKQQAPFDAVSVDGDFTAAQASYANAQNHIDMYNDEVKRLNTLIEAKKAAIQAGNLLAVQNELARLRTAKRRYDPTAITACDELTAAEAAKKVLEKQKERAKASLDNYTKTVFGKYEYRINQLLDNFGAGFQIGNTKGRYTGGLPSSQYNLVINNTSVDLGDPDDPPDAPRFRNTLSAGDKSTLALSFFVARAEQDPSLSDKILVFDDPFTSQDHSRRTCTQQLITMLAKNAKQVIVLSHDPSFLRLIHDVPCGSPVKAIQISGWGSHGAKLTEWDIVEATKGGYIEAFRVLATYIHQGTGPKRQVAQTIRPFLEQYMRLKLPTSFAEKEWLGDMIEKIRHCTDPADPLYDAQTILQELTDINDYAKKFHHSIPDTAPPQIDDGELFAYSNRAIKFVQMF